MKYLIILLFIWTTHAYNFSKNCGVSTTLGTAGCTPVKGENRAIVPPGQMPWHVQVNITHKGVSKLLCSGVLITMRHILTAAQCLTVNNTIRPNDKIKIRAGSSLLNQGQFIKAKKISIHPNFTQILPFYINTPLYKVDLAVVELEYEFNSSLNITPICLPLHENIVKDKDLVIVSGWTTTFDEENLGGDYFSPGYFFSRYITI
ncbi:clotting factor B [Lepeophtheirus salmonis]|uniref:clotting factor B n=1 Tax=Lepeophtheirus salmonis TaxID=72036 RepID=UPI001AE74001|nr:clotting factor B-like [Lepeophtheirus salmonis]